MDGLDAFPNQDPGVGQNRNESTCPGVQLKTRHDDIGPDCSHADNTGFGQ